MRAIRFHEYGGPEVLRYEQDVPEPSLAPDAVLVEADAASVNPIDWKMARVPVKRTSRCNCPPFRVGT